MDDTHNCGNILYCICLLWCVALWVERNLLHHMWHFKHVLFMQYLFTMNWSQRILSQKFSMKRVKHLCRFIYITDSASYMYLWACSVLVCIVKGLSEANWRLVCISDSWINITQYFYWLFQVSSRTASICRRKGSSSFSSHYFYHWHRSCKCDGLNLT